MQTKRKQQTMVSIFPERSRDKGQDAARCHSGAGTTEALALNWLEGHARIMGFWLDRLVAENADIGLIDTLHRQSAWLQSMQDRLAR